MVARHRLPGGLTLAVLGLALLAGCAQASGTAPSSGVRYFPVAAVPDADLAPKRCARYAERVGAQPARIGPGLKVTDIDRVVVCSDDKPWPMAASGDWAKTDGYLVDTPRLARLLPLLAAADEPRGFGPCAAMYVGTPWLLLVTMDGEVLQPVVPTDECGNPRADAVALMSPQELGGGLT